MAEDSTGGKKWKLSTFVVIVLSIWVAAFAGLAFYALARLVQGGRALLYAPASLRCAAMVIAGMGASSYIYVSAIAPRPAQLHRNGLLPLLLLPELGATIVSRLLGSEGAFPESFAFSAVSYTFRPFIVALFMRLVKQKIGSLGPPPRRCLDLAVWANLLVAISFLAAFGGLVPVAIYRSYTYSRGGEQVGPAPAPPPRPGNRTRGRERGDEEKYSDVYTNVGEGIAQGSLVLMGLMYVAAVVVSTRYVSRALARLVLREVRDEQLLKVRRMVRRHAVGMLSGFLADLSFIVLTTIDLQNVFGDELADDYVTSIAALIDASGDTIGVLLLSGVGALLLGRGSNPDAGDVSGKLRGLLHAAVLTSRADTVFEGRVAKTSSLRCVASFPGKYVREWNALTWLCEQGDLSCACVFLPGSDPQQRFGRHFDCPETPGQCWCHSLYGCVQPWGCLWFEAWRKNIEAAVSLGLELVVVYFPGQVGHGRVLWEDLGTSDLWDGQGLGGSQKAEVAYLRKRGIEFLEEDLSSFRRTLATKTRSLGSRSSTTRTLTSGTQS